MTPDQQLSEKKSISMTDQPEKMDLRSYDIAEEKRQEMLRLFPEIRTEGDKIDFERLRLALGEMVDAGRERYGMNWPGKADCFKTIQSPSLGTLRPCPEESVDFDTTENLIIEGDNLEVLKLLQKSYLGKVKMIYIDPPYNTGNDFIYPDNYTESLQTYLEYTGQTDAEGKKFGTNTDTDGRFHSKWMNMMYPRLYLAKNLLRDDGTIFVSCDDGEIHNLRILMNEIFGEENFVECFTWKRSYGGGAKEKHAVSQHEYIMLYSRSVDFLGQLWLPADKAVEKKYYKYRDGKYNERGPYRLQPLEAGKSMDRRDNLVFSIPMPDGRLVTPKRQWLWSQERVIDAIKNDILVFNEREDEITVSYKQYLVNESGEKRGTKPVSIIEGIYTQHGTQELVGLFDGEQYFQFPKPSRLLQYLAQFSTGTDDIVLDFFAGSGTMAHAVLELNQTDGGNRKFILVQLPEPTEYKKYPTIADITKERVRRVIQKLADGDAEKGKKKKKTKKEQQPSLFAANELDAESPLRDSASPRETDQQDLGFRVFKLDQSNFTTWDAGIEHDAQELERQLELHIDHIRDGRSPDDILYELLLKSGFPLTTPIETLSLEGKTVYRAAGGALAICLELELTLELIRAIAETKPERVVCLDAGFAGNDQLKANAVQIFKTKGITSFKTV